MAGGAARYAEQGLHDQVLPMRPEAGPVLPVGGSRRRGRGSFRQIVFAAGGTWEISSALPQASGGSSLAVSVLMTVTTRVTVTTKRTIVAPRVKLTSAPPWL